MTQLLVPLPPPSPIQAPDRCPYCNSPKLRPKGQRIKKLETVKQQRCESCGRTSLPGPRALRNKTYPIHEILEGISLYNQGYTLEQTAKVISSRHGHPVNPSTISRWLAQHPTLTTYRRLRDIGRKRFHPSNVMPTTKLYHAQVYEYSWHRAKLDALRDGSLDPSRSRTQTKFANVADFLESIPRTCPHGLFRREDGTRGSRLPSTFINLDSLIVTERRNTATDTAALIIPSVGSNHQRHTRLQRFLLTNDACTLAVEVPIWLDEAAISALEAEHSITLVAKQPADSADPGGTHKPRHLTGHIDFLQIRHGALHLLDYKPDARTNRPVAQLTAYALALTWLVPGLTLFDIKCAWFNEAVYDEFFPRKALSAASPARNLS